MENAAFELGTTLRELREKKGLSIDDVSRHLKIPPATLCLMEEGEYSKLPHPVYARSFVKVYAREVGMEAAELDNYLNTLFETGQETQPASVYTPVDETSTKIAWRFPLLVIVFLCIFAGGAWLFYANFLNGFLSPSADRPSDTSSLLPSTLGRSSNESERLSENTNDAERLPNRKYDETAEEKNPFNLTESSRIHASIGDEKTTETSGSTTGISSGSVPEASPVAPERASATLPSLQDRETEKRRDEENLVKHQIFVDATMADCWIRVSYPSGEKKDIFLHKGQSVTLPYSEEMTVRFGNIYGVTVYNDGQIVEYPKDGAPVRTLNFPL